MPDPSRELADALAAWRTASESADRFRDVLCEAFDLAENPGDDVLVRRLRMHFGKTGPEPTAWRDRLAGYQSQLAEGGLFVRGHWNNPR